ncbi:NETI motif-containing protein [Alkalihalobacillus trypoxylicola]|uniref:NETI motif-containing protein n=1 Tax=Alkalihalobacillus trypoxylicola TaxID=519424 RepID=A0A161QGL1_9BACI|nr:NETI motif-containing protein [Alkalihalobacillus trypoxylicola]KYG28080.1 hypothetical protein AZF04_09240 [Alkalihalobacillus trypoxylicola]GAF65567.1 hypothetical protein BTS2_2465 [Bacillus sp. TS-2]
MKFEVQEGETVSECIERMKESGYTPVRRIEKPVFAEKKQGHHIDYEPIRQVIIFEGHLIEDEQ